MQGRRQHLLLAKSEFGTGCSESKGQTWLMKKGWDGFRELASNSTSHKMLLKVFECA